MRCGGRGASSCEGGEMYWRRRLIEWGRRGVTVWFIVKYYLVLVVVME